MKADFLFAGAHITIIIQKKHQEKAHLMDEGLKISTIQYLNVENGCCLLPLSKFLATRPRGPLGAGGPQKLLPLPST